MTGGTTSVTIRVAVPSANADGLLSGCNEHFGRCPHFTVVEIVDGRPANIMTVNNPPHKDCFDPVRLLASQNVNAIIVQGIGMRPLVGFKSVGIDVYAGRGETVGDLITAFVSGKLELLDESGVCGGGRQHG